jgi:hypothetical protein
MAKGGRAMPAIAEAVKLFLEKHLIPSVVSFALACVALLLFPDTFPIRVKLGTTWFILFAFAVSFIAVQLLMWIGRGIKHRLALLKEYEYKINQSERNLEENFEQLWNIIDKFTPDDRAIIRKFVGNGNQALLIETPHPMYQGLLDTQFVHKTGADEWQRHQYVLKSDFYGLVKLSLEKHSCICHFE